MLGRMVGGGGVIHLLPSLPMLPYIVQIPSPAWGILEAIRWGYFGAFLLHDIRTICHSWLVTERHCTICVLASSGDILFQVLQPFFSIRCSSHKFTLFLARLWHYGKILKSFTYRGLSYSLISPDILARLKWFWSWYTILYCMLRLTAYT